MKTATKVLCGAIAAGLGCAVIWEVTQRAEKRRKVRCIHARQLVVELVVSQLAEFVEIALGESASVVLTEIAAQKYKNGLRRGADWRVCGGLLAAKLKFHVEACASLLAATPDAEWRNVWSLLQSYRSADHANDSVPAEVRLDSDHKSCIANACASLAKQELPLPRGRFRRLRCVFVAVHAKRLEQVLKEGLTARPKRRTIDASASALDAQQRYLERSERQDKDTKTEDLVIFRVNGLPEGCKCIQRRDKKNGVRHDMLLTSAIPLEMIARVDSDAVNTDTFEGDENDFPVLPWSMRWENTDNID
ncbi:MAG: hypothetical protein MHM6MM_008232 [Cercozoa sp. M6MM]